MKHDEAEIGKYGEEEEEENRICMKSTIVNIIAAAADNSLQLRRFIE